MPSSLCQRGELYDPFLERCRTVFCVSGTANEDGNCIDDFQFDITPSSVRFSLFDDKCNALINNTFYADVLYWQVNPINIIQAHDKHQAEVSLLVIVERFQLTKNLNDRVFETFDNHTVVFELCNITTVTAYVTEGANLLSRIDGCANGTLLASDVFSTSRQNQSDFEFKLIESFTWTQQNSTFTSRSVVPQECLDLLKLNCTEIIKLNINEFVFRSAVPSIVHLSTGQEFKSDEFVILADGVAVICGPVNWTDSNVFARATVSLVCSCLSLVALFATLFTYCLFPSLRNLAGMYTMNLVVALFIANLLLVLAGTIEIEGYNCVVTASLIHFSWLSGFFWMAMLSYNAAKTFRGRHVLAGGSERSKYRRLMASMSLVWGGALLIVSACLVLTLCNCTTLPAVYKKSPPCWIGNVNVLIVVFGVPVATTLLLSTCFFIFVFWSVRKTKRDCKMVQKKGRAEEILDEVKIYTKVKHQ